ncbi:hypothetical protein KIH39_00090 [Telmatocola sphagniphila]|uniref:Uncharacterized protein n=1 Tax=Telmatocola sphagniphila TaxID=1123043 RepID=A0A8E6B6H1_9BACT|nr:hypothetical protein [Telmatocola sphagniphila]QVL32354.1 hypothetical protein KIH39_00090 [Telmatocola sphagniphila]
MDNKWIKPPNAPFPDWLLDKLCECCEDDCSTCDILQYPKLKAYVEVVPVSLGFAGPVYRCPYIFSVDLDKTTRGTDPFPSTRTCALFAGNTDNYPDSIACTTPGPFSYRGRSSSGPVILIGSIAMTCDGGDADRPALDPSTDATFNCGSKATTDSVIFPCMQEYNLAWPPVASPYVRSKKFLLNANFSFFDIGPDSTFNNDIIPQNTFGTAKAIATSCDPLMLVFLVPMWSAYDGFINTTCTQLECYFRITVTTP